MPKNLLLEIGTEEIPAGFLPKALESLKVLMESTLSERRLISEGTETLGTPRRLAIVVKGLIGRQPDAVVEVTGPPRKAAFDEEGRPTKAALGFARSHGIDIRDIEVVTTKRGDYLFVKKIIKGRKTKDIMREAIPSIVTGISFPKTMRWGDGEVAFARPIHWILALYGSKRISFSVGDVKSGSFTRGHRFLGARPLKVDGVGSYLKRLRESYVIADPGERFGIIEEGVSGAAGSVNGRCLEDRDLLAEVSNLVEFPVVLTGRFDEDFLYLPKDVIVNAMREHQRYFSVVDGDNNLLPYFITVANTAVSDPGEIIRGNERVLRARLNDARFYFERDRKVPLVERVDALKGVVFQERLGTSYEKVERFTALAVYIGERIGLCKGMDNGEGPADFLGKDLNPVAMKESGPEQGVLSKAVIGRASMLSKADLVSEMVGEFPKLQGIMGSIYAEYSGEAPEVSRAIYEHYLPLAAGGELPASMPGAVIGMADKMDTICGCFGVGLVPSGTFDPYALRRQALGIIAIILDKGFRISLHSIVDRSLDLLQDRLRRPVEEVEEEVLEFFRERLRHQLLSQGELFDTVDSVLSTRWYDIPDTVNRVEALGDFRDNPDCERLVIAFKRVSNILKGLDLSAERPDRSLFETEYEDDLYSVIEEISPVVEAYRKEGDYRRVFETLGSIKDRIDIFFDKVMVMADDDTIRNNRLLLMNYVRGLYINIADLSRLVVSRG